MKNKKIKLFLVIFCLIVVSNVPHIESKEMNGKIIYVDENGGKDYVTIQDAIDNSSKGDIIYVYNGTYNEFLFINKSVYLIGESKEKTIIEGGNGPLVKIDNFFQTNNPKNSTSLINIKSDDITIKNFKIKNSSFIDKIMVYFYFKSRVCYPPNYIFQHTNIGIGISISSNNCKIVDNIIEMNGADGINLYNSDNNLISNNTIINNSFCGIYLRNSSNNCIINNTISCNGLGISFANLSFQNILYHNNFKNNTRKHIFNDENNTFHNKDLKHGNYWDDYNGTDKNYDGIGDKAYNLPSGKNEDKYPLVFQYHGKLIKDSYIDIETIIQILIIGVVLSIIFLLPIAYYWRKKYFR